MEGDADPGFYGRHTYQQLLEMKDDLFKDLILKFLRGVATPHEKQMLGNWLREDPSREEIFYYYLSKKESESPQYLPKGDLNADAYEKYMNGEVQKPRHPFRDQERKVAAVPATLGYRWWMAASILVLMSASFYLMNDSVFYKTYTSYNGKIRSVTLDDGSQVTLNANSSIKVLRDLFSHEDREVWIKGEAFFEVTRKNDQQKFIVHTDNLDVEVLGTKFNVNNRRNKTEVMLAEGKVKLVAKDIQPLIMEPGEQVSLSGAHERFEKQSVEPEKYEAWRNNMLVFENTPLSEVTQIIQDYYGVKMIVSDSLLGKRQFTGTLPNNDLDVILLALRTSYKINIDRRDDHIFLSN